MFKNTSPLVNASEEASVATPSVTVSPNSAGNEVVFNFKNLVPANYRLALFDEMGRLMVEKTV